MVKTPKISVLVPVYNVEKTLSLCLESIINQSFKDFEVVLIDDGSTDSSLSIAKRFAKKDNRIKIHSGKNGGYGVAMNKAIKYAKGKYVCIVETDDFIHKEYLKTLFGLAEHYKTDIVKCSFVNYFSKTGKSNPEILFHTNHERVETEKVFSASENQNVFLTIPSIWAGLYKRDFLEKKKIKFLETPGASFQDIGFQFKTYAAAKRIYCTNLPLYYYTKDNDLSSVKNSKNVFPVVQEFNGVDDFIADHKLDKFQTVADICRARSYMWNINRLNFKNAKMFVKQTGPQKINIKDFNINCSGELKFYSKHPLIYAYIRPVFRLKNLAMSRAYKIYNVIIKSNKEDK